MGKEVIENTTDQTGHPQQDHLDSSGQPLPQSQSLGSVHGKLEAAGNELVNALDNAFAEFEDEDFTLDDDDDGGVGEHDVEQDHYKQDNDAKCNITDEDAAIPKQLQDTHSETGANGAQESNDEIHVHVHTDVNGNEIDNYNDSDTDTECTSNINPNNNAKTNAKTNTNDKMMPLPKVVSTALPLPAAAKIATGTGTDEELEEELEKRVAEWINHADDSDSDSNGEEEKKNSELSLMAKHMGDAPIQIQIQDQDQDTGCDAAETDLGSAFEIDTGIDIHTKELQDLHLPPRNILSSAMADFVSPLFVREKDFGFEGTPDLEQDEYECDDGDSDGNGNGNGNGNGDGNDLDRMNLESQSKLEYSAEEDPKIDEFASDHGATTSVENHTEKPQTPASASIPTQGQELELHVEDDLDYSYTVDSTENETLDLQGTKLELNGSHSGSIERNSSPSIPLQELSKDVNDDLDISNNWDFDDVDSLPSELNITLNDSQPQAEAQEQMIRSLSDVKESSSDIASTQEIEGKIEKETATETDTTDKKLNDDSPDTSSGTSPSPTDVTKIEDLPFFKSQQIRSEELAHSNAEDVLSLSLEIQNLQAQLRKERESHQITLEEVKREKSTRIKIEDELQERRREHAVAQNTYCDDVQELMAECQQAKVKIRAAEQDAEEALELAEENAKSRAEMEGFLQRALDELESLRSQTQQLPMIVEDSSDMLCETNDGDNLSQAMSTLSTPSRHSPLRLDRRRAGISAGRSLLRQVQDNDEMSYTSTQDGSAGSTNTDTSYYITLSRRSAENRERLLNRLKKPTDSSSTDGDVVVFSASDGEGLDLNYTHSLSKSVKSIANVIRKSGKSLGFGGRWFTRRANRHKSKGEDETDLEAMAKNYCKNVEILVSKQEKDLKELQSFCDYLESKVAES